MGLLEYINNNFFTRNSKESEGLLSLAEKYINSSGVLPDDEDARENLPSEPVKNTQNTSNAPSVLITPYDITKPYESFIAMCKELFLYKAGLYVENEKDFSMGFSYNLEDKTIEKSHSTKSFWKGTLDNNDWQSFQKDELIVFYQLFSTEELESLTKLYFKRFYNNNKNYIFFTTMLDNSDMDFEKIEKLLNSFLSGISDYLRFSTLLDKNISRQNLETNIKSGLEQFNKGQYMELNLIPIMNKISGLNKYELLKIGNHIFNLINKTISKPNICVDYPGRIKLVYFSNDEIDPQMLEFQIKKTLQPFLNADIINLLAVTNPKTLNTFDLIISKLLGK